MKKQPNHLATFAALAIGATLVASSSFAQTVDTARIEAGGQNDWLTYHGSYKSYHYSPLAQINASNVSSQSIGFQRRCANQNNAAIMTAVPPTEMIMSCCMPPEISAG